MGWLDALKGRSAPAATSQATAPVVPPLPIPYVSSATVLGLSAVWRCVTLICDVTSRMPWQEWKGDELLQPSRLIRAPMSEANMDRREWMWRVIATEAIHNTVHLLHVGGTDTEGLPWSLLPLPPSAIWPATPADPWGLLQPADYIVAGQHVPASRVTVVRRAPFPGIPDAVAGIIDLARRQFSAYLAADALNQRYWSNGGPTSTIIKTDQDLDDTDATTLVNRWDARRQTGGTAALGKGADAHPFGADPTTESAVEARTQMVADIGRYFGVPTRILNAPAHDSETYANVEFDALDLKRYTLDGYTDPVAWAISGLLPGDSVTGRRMVVDPTQFVSGDLGSRADAYTKLVDSGIYTVDEARVRGFGLPALTREPSTASTPATDALPAAMSTVNTDGPLAPSTLR